MILYPQGSHRDLITGERSEKILGPTENVIDHSLIIPKNLQQDPLNWPLNLSI